MDRARLLNDWRELSAIDGEMQHLQAQYEKLYDSILEQLPERKLVPLAGENGCLVKAAVKRPGAPGNGDGEFVFMPFADVKEAPQCCKTHHHPIPTMGEV